jgi:ubiquinone/menaquinone biosynthesis C-methylase UbiE
VRNLVDERPTLDLHGGSAFARTFVEAADIQGCRVLDIGCGFGWFELVALHADAKEVVAIEPSSRDLATAQAHIPDPRVKFRVASATSLPFDDCSFDTVVCWEVLEHLPLGGEPQAFAEIARVLARNGVLYLSTPSADLRSRATDPAWWLTSHRHYTAERLRELAVGAGLSVERLIAKGGWWQIAAMTNLYVAKWIFRRRPFAEHALNRRVDREWRNRCGFTNLYLRAAKV